jgi:hypothetical protein
MEAPNGSSEERHGADSNAPINRHNHKMEYNYRNKEWVSISTTMAPSIHQYNACSVSALRGLVFERMHECRPVMSEPTPRHARKANFAGTIAEEERKLVNGNINPADIKLKRKDWGIRNLSSLFSREWESHHIYFVNLREIFGGGAQAEDRWRRHCRRMNRDQSEQED